MRYIPLFFLSASIFAANGQDKNATSFGFKGGINRSIVNGYELNGSKTGYVGMEMYGAFFSDTKLNTRWRFENELLYSFTDEYHFIELPLHIKYSLLKHTFIFLGLKIDMIVNNDNQFYEFNNFGMSVEFGAQYEITKRIISEFRYSTGLMKQINDIVLEIYDGRRNTIRLGIGIRFNK